VAKSPNRLFEPAANAGEADTGKTLSALRRSREGINEVLALFGGRELVPTSVMRTRRVRAADTPDEHAAGRNYADCGPPSKKRLLSDGTVPDGVKDMARRLDYRGVNGKGALSKFPQDIGRSVVLFYTEPGALVVDPFAGHNSRMELVVRAGRDYVGCDLCEGFMEHNIARRRKLLAEFPGRSIRLHHCDSRRQPIPSGVGDFTITSPPYWDVEYYGDEPEQLGNCPTYDDFLRGLFRVLTENHRTLKVGAYSCWFVNDFRKAGKMHFLHRDLMNHGQSLGFELHDLMVVDLGLGMRDQFVLETMRTRIIPKRHEYMIVFRKVRDAKK